VALENTNRKIVKTDALIAESLAGRGLYEILPYRTRLDKKIVKTDALIVEIRAHSGFTKVLRHSGLPITAFYTVFNHKNLLYMLRKIIEYA
jgi:hypothetical protein